MFIKDFKCNKCNKDTLTPDFNLTIDSYVKNEFNLDSILNITLEKPTKRPGYIIFKCIEKDCNNIVKLTEKEILDKLLEDWADLGWKMAQHYMINCTDFEGYKTRYIYDEIKQEFLFNKDPLSYNSIYDIYKNFLNYTKDDKKKHIK